MDNQFVFDKKTKAFTGILMLIGILSLVLTALFDEHDNIRLLTNILHNSVFFAGIAFAALLFISTHTMAWGGWHTVFKRIPEAMMMFLPFGGILLGVLGVLVALDFVGTDFLYMWSDEDRFIKDGPHYDELVEHKSSFLNTTNYFLTIAVVFVWTFFAMGIRKLSIQQDNDPNLREKNMHRTRVYAAVFLPVAGFSSAFAIWQWIMSVDAHWYSTLFAWYVTVSFFVSAVAIILLIAIFLQSKGLLKQFTKEHMHDLGKYIFGFSVFWTYLWFSQFLLIWYANNGEETQYFFLRFEQFKPIFFANLLINFVAPFLILMMNSSKRTLGTVGFVAGLVIFGHWLDFYQMIKPGVWYNYEHAQHAGHGHGDNHGHDAHEEKHDAHGDLYRLKKSDLNNGHTAMLTDFQEEHNHEHGEHHHDNADSTHTHTDSTHAHADKDSTHAHNHDHEEHSENTGGHAHTEHHEDGGHGDDHGHGHHAPQFILGIHFPGLLEIGTLLGFLGGFLFVTFSFLSRASLYPGNDPYIHESEHHHT